MTRHLLERYFSTKSHTGLFVGAVCMAVLASACGASPRRSDASNWGSTGASSLAPQEADDEIKQRITKLSAALRLQGYEPLEAPVYGKLETFGISTHWMDFESASCYAVAALGAPQQDWNLVLLDPAGQTAAHDVRLDEHPWVSICPNVNGRYTARIQLNKGRGSYYFAAYKGKGARQVDLARYFSDPSKGVTVVAQSSKPASGAVAVVPTISAAGKKSSLDDNYRLLDSDLRTRGYTSTGAAVIAAVAAATVKEIPLRLIGEKCYALGVSSESGSVVQARILDANKRPLDEDMGKTSQAVVRTCTKSDGDYRLQVRTEGPATAVMHGTYVWPRGTKGPFGLRGVVYVRLAEMTTLLASQGYNPDPDYSVGRGTLNGQGERATHDLKLSGGRCYSVLVVGDLGVNDLKVNLYRSEQSVAASQSHHANPEVRYCARGNEDLKLTISAERGEGAYVYQIFRQSSSR